jgi:competence protein ComFB
MTTKLAPKNIMEDLVEGKLSDLMRSANMCCCERCRADVKALALNKLPPRYVVSVGGDVYSHFQALNVQNQINITAAIAAAIRIVRLSPHHDEQYA